LFQARRPDPGTAGSPLLIDAAPNGNTLLVKDLERLAEMVHAATGE